MIGGISFAKWIYPIPSGKYAIKTSSADEIMKYPMVALSTKLLKKSLRYTEDLYRQ